jgi:Protein of unknown function (DUF4013)
MQLPIRASARFPLEGADWQRKLLLGGGTGLLLELVFVGLAQLLSGEAAFGIAPLVVIVNFPALGFLCQVFRGVLHSEVGVLPEWENWSRLLKSGLGAFGIGLAYGMVPLLLLLLGLGLLVRGGINLFLGMVLMVLGVLAGVFTLFFLPMALGSWLLQNRVEVAFHPATLWDRINAVLAEYVAGYLVSVGAHILAGLVAAIPFLGPLVWPFLWFYLMLAQARLFGELCAKAA